MNKIKKNNINKIIFFYIIFSLENNFTSQLYSCFVYWINNRQLSSVYLHDNREHRFIYYVTRYIVRGR